MSFRLQMVVLSAGERLPVLKEATGTPHWFATLFATTQLRNPGNAPNTTLSVLAAVRSLLIWAETRKICIESEARCQVPCDPIERRIWRFAAARDAMSRLITELRAER